MLASNNLGEDVQDIRITLPDDAVWPGLSSSELRIDGGNDGLVRIGDTYVFRTKDKAFFKGLSSKRLAVTYESESAVVSETVTLGDFSSSIRGECELNCPYLFFEDFSWVEGFNSNDEYGWSSPGSFHRIFLRLIPSMLRILGAQRKVAGVLPGLERRLEPQSESLVVGKLDWPTILPGRILHSFPD